MIKSADELPRYNYKKIGRTALLILVPSSLVLLLFTPLFINLTLSIFDADSRQLYSEYENLLAAIIDFEPWIITILIVQLIVLYFTINHYGRKAAKKILAMGKQPFLVGVDTMLSIWLCLMASVIATILFFETVIYTTNGFVDNLIHTIVFSLLYIIIPYFFLGIIHSLIMAYFVGSTIKYLSKQPNYTYPQ